MLPIYPTSPVDDRDNVRRAFGFVNEIRYQNSGVVDVICIQNGYTSGMTLRPEQCRAARGLLAWSQDQLAKSAGVGNSTVRDFEKGRRVPLADNLAAVREALEKAGVLFESDGKHVGVKLKIKRGKQ